MDSNARRDAFIEYVGFQERVAEQLIALAADTANEYQDYDTRVLAMMLLATVPTRESIELLTLNLDWRPNVAMPELDPSSREFNGYPAAQALSVIGLSCLPALLQSIYRPPQAKVSDERLELTARLLLRLHRRGYGDRGVREARLALERKIDRLSGMRVNQSQAEHLRILLARMRDIAPEYGPAGAWGK